MPTATVVLTDVAGYAGPATCYQLSEPLTDRAGGRTHEYVVVFTVEAFGGLADRFTPETIIVPAYPNGAAVVMNKLPGSMTGIADPAGALWAAGGFEHGEPYTIVVPEEGVPTEEEVAGVPADPELTDLQKESIEAAKADPSNVGLVGAPGVDDEPDEYVDQNVVLGGSPEAVLPLLSPAEDDRDGSPSIE
jgi:hypothetical protein